MTDIAIYFNGRCGSTWLMDYLYVNLNNNGIDVDCLWEYWAENRTYHISESHIEPKSMHDWNWTAENIDQDQLFADKVNLLESNPANRLIRFTEHNGYVDKPFDYMLSSNVKWVVMNRHDRFDQMISHAMCWTTNLWHAWDQNQLDEYKKFYEANQITIPREMCENWLQSYLRFNQRRRRLQESGLIIGQVTYEKMKDDAKMVTGDLLSLLGVKEPVLSNPEQLKGSTIKLGTPEDKSKWVANYADLKSWYESSQWPNLIG